MYFRWWWLRSPYYGGVGSFCNVNTGSSNNNNANNSNGVFAAILDHKVGDLYTDATYVMQKGIISSV